MKKVLKTRVRKVLTVILAVVLVVVVGGYFYVRNNPQFVVGIVQSALYQGKPINSFEPAREPGEAVKENGIYYVNDVQYGTEYPNSYLDISYPDSDVAKDRPTLIYFHGGGYFGGDKAMGDPLAANDDANALFDRIVQDGYNLVNVDYALVPDYRFPVPVLQMNEAINFLVDHAADYHLDMDNVVVMGSSAGASMTAQYGAIITNSDYAASFGITPKLTKDQVKCLVVDDAPLDVDHFGFGIMVLIGNYLDGSMNVKGTAAAEQYDAILHLNSDNPPTFMTAGNGDGFPEDMKLLSDTLTSLGVDNQNYVLDPSAKESKHGYLANIANDKNAEACYQEMIAFVNKYTGNSGN